MVFSGLLLFQAVLLAYKLGRSLRTDTSRMALFTSKPFEKTRACHDNFPFLKGNIHSYYGSGSNTILNRHLFLLLTFMFIMKRPLERDRGVAMPMLNIVLRYSYFYSDRDTHPLKSKTLYEKSFNFERFACSRHKPTAVSLSSTRLWYEGM